MILRVLKGAAPQEPLQPCFQLRKQRVRLAAGYPVRTSYWGDLRLRLICFMTAERREALI